MQRGSVFIYQQNDGFFNCLKKKLLCVSRAFVWRVKQKIFSKDLRSKRREVYFCFFFICFRQLKDPSFQPSHILSSKIKHLFTHHTPEWSKIMKSSWEDADVSKSFRAAVVKTVVHSPLKKKTSFMFNQWSQLMVQICNLRLHLTCC